MEKYLYSKLERTLSQHDPQATTQSIENKLASPQSYVSSEFTSGNVISHSRFPYFIDIAELDIRFRD